MPIIDRIVLRCLDPESQCSFYCDILGMQNFGEGIVGYGAREARLEFLSAGVPYAPTPLDRYWKIALAVPDIELACRQLEERGVKIGLPRQFKDIGYLAHFQDPEGFTIELIEHTFKNQRDINPVDTSFLGGGAHLNLLTLRTTEIEKSRQTALDCGMVPLSVQPVEDHQFTLHFFAFTDETPPNSDLLAIENRPWLYQRPYTILEFQELHQQLTIESSDHNYAGYSGFSISDSDDSTVFLCESEF